MEIDNNTNIQNLVASSISKLNLNSIAGAASNVSQNKKQNQDIIQENKEDDVKLIDENQISKSPIDVVDVKKYAGMIGEDVTEEEIKYGLMYGRSVIADFLA